MGVHGLWDLLAPVGRRVSVETLAGRRLAIDASIWMIQFMKAMRDDKGDMIRNAHLVGFFRRICKLLFLRTKPVFVFDGGTPALKRRTVIARRRQRENAQAKIRKVAEKLLLNQLKAARLKDLAESLENHKLANAAKGKKVASDQPDSVETSGTSGSRDVEKMDELLAASLAAEDYDGGFGYTPVAGHRTGAFAGSSSASGAAHLDDDDEADEELILPMGNGGVDPAVLAALPPSMQLELLVQMRERLMAENRQKYQRVKKAPQKFSELQIESYLKTVAFRREIDGVQKAAAGKGMDGLQTSRIASEANREFFFSSTFTGDKQELASSGVRKADKRLEQSGKDHSSFEIVSSKEPAVKSHPDAATTVGKPAMGFNDEVQTYLDERGHVRVSRVRAMGIRMTRDLQRNLDLMRELEQEALSKNETENVQLDLHEKVPCDLGNSGLQEQLLQTGDDCLEGDNGSRGVNSPMEGGIPIEITFEDGENQKSSEDVDDLFANLVAGNPIIFPTTGGHSPLGTYTSDPDSDCEWEEGTVGQGHDFSINERDKGVDASEVDALNHNDDELDWQEGVPERHKDHHLSTNAFERPLSKGSLEEEVALQEAIRRSLEDAVTGMPITVPSEWGKIGENVIISSSLPFEQANTTAKPGIQMVNSEHAMETPSILLADSNKLSPNTYINAVSGDASASNVVSHDKRVVINLPRSFRNSDYQKRNEDASSSGVLKEIMESKSADLADPDLIDNSSHVASIHPSSKAPDTVLIQKESTSEHAVADTLFRGQMTDENSHGLVQDTRHDGNASAVEPSKEANLEFDRTNVEDELQALSREYISLEEEQRKLERNAESVNGEMFVECQELLQMFGLPYIIAPMEAEAQCAFMERAKLVDGVVTDDSDVFLFGARSVYKNIFDDRKYVETYIMKDVEDELGLDQEKLICMALLLGSDYTEGISGIGIVNAIEVINAFPEEDGLQKFREWIESPDPMILGKSGMRNKSKMSDTGSSSLEPDTERTLAGDGNGVVGTDSQTADSNIQSLRQIFMDKHRNVSKNWHIPSSFPSEAVISAYKAPQVDKSTDPFSWGKPDLFSLRRLCWEKFGWANQRADELLLPVLKEYNKHETQLRLEAFYTFNERFAKIRSKRIKQAVKGIMKNQSTESTTQLGTADGACGNVQKSKVRSSNPRNKRKKPADDASGTADYSAEHTSRPRKRKAQEVGAGREKEKARGNSRAGSTGRRKTSFASGVETSSSDVDCIDDQVLGTEAEKPGGECSRRKVGSLSFSLFAFSPALQNYLFLLLGIEKSSEYFGTSMRPRKATKYEESDVEIDESDDLEKYNANCLMEIAEPQSRHENILDTGDGARSTVVQPPVGEELLVTSGFCEDYLVKGGGFCADEDNVEADEAQCCSHDNDGTTCDPDTDHLQAGCSFEDNVDMNQNEHEYVPSRTARDAAKTTNSSLCFSEAKMGKDNSIEGKLIKSSGGSIEGLLRGRLNGENQEDQPLNPNDNISKRDKRILVKSLMIECLFRHPGLSRIKLLQLVLIMFVTDIYGHMVCYFRCEPHVVQGWSFYFKATLPFLAMIMVECIEVGLTTISKAAMIRGMSNFVFVVYYNGLGTIFLLPYFTCQCLRRKTAPITCALLSKLLLLGLIGICLLQLCAYAGINYTSPTLATAIGNLIPVFTFLLAIILRMEKLDLRNISSKAKSIGTIIAISGALVVTLYRGPPVLMSQKTSDPSHQLFSKQFNWLIGCVLLLVTCLLSSIGNIFQAAIAKEHADALSIVFFYSLFGTMQSAVLSYFLEKNPSSWKLHNGIEISAIVYAVRNLYPSFSKLLQLLSSRCFAGAPSCCNVFYCLENTEVDVQHYSQSRAVSVAVLRNSIVTWCLRERGPVFVAMYKPLGIVIAVAMSFVFLGDTLYLGSIIGASAIVAGFYAVTWGQAKEKEMADTNAGDFDTLSSHKSPLLQNVQV
ncbi:DNA repair protein UVH3-like protein [Drosera capensis]